MAKPVFIASRNTLFTLEVEFARWKVDVPFVNINSPEISSEEIGILKHDISLKNANDIKKANAIKNAKLCIWAMGKCVLGISYELFGGLASGHKGETVKKALLQHPGLLVLDERHTLRNEDTNIWKVLYEVSTKKIIILSGTPFQNNFVELNNTLSLIRREFRDPWLNGNCEKKIGTKGKRKLMNDRTKVDDERSIKVLRNQLKPFVHVHKGEILRETLRGLFHTVLVLKPSELQKKYFRYLAGIKYGSSLNYLVSIASVHLSLLYQCEQVPESFEKEFLAKYKTDLDVGVKIRFLFDLIKLSKGDKVLVFSQFLIPLVFIGDLLKTHFNWTEGNEFMFMKGNHNPKSRQSMIRSFNDPDSEVRVLLASTMTCCEGLHLVGASRVVLLDVVSNLSVERQAISRAYRIGQKKDVYVYHLITSGTQEGQKYYQQMAKDCVSEQLFTSTEGGGQKTISLSMEDRVLDEMIQHEKMKKLFEIILPA